MTADRLVELREIVRSLRTIGAGVSNLTGNPWRYVEKRDWTPLWQRDVEERLETTIRACDRYAAATLDVSQILGFPKSDWTGGQLVAMTSAAGFLLNPPAVSKALVVDSNWTALRNGLLELITHGRERVALS
jgi:hypothetical protein